MLSQNNENDMKKMKNKFSKSSVQKLAMFKLFVSFLSDTSIISREGDTTHSIIAGRMDIEHGEEIKNKFL